MHLNQGRNKLAMAFMLYGFSVLTAYANTTHETIQQDSQSHTFRAYFIAKRPKLELQLGGFTATQGTAQDIQIQGLVGDHFSVNHRSADNVLLGAGVYFEGPTWKQTAFSYGVNAFYFPQTTVKGDVTQEQLFTNLSYQYTLSNMPVYFAGKARVNNLYNSQYNLTFSAGIGPNFIRTGNVNERSLDGGVTLPEAAFAGQTSTALSAMLGVGVEFKQVFKQMPLECGYRFFYLGQGRFSKRSTQLINTLKTGNNYANALICSVTF
jgi:hypothetical protein